MRPKSTNTKRQFGKILGEGLSEPPSSPYYFGPISRKYNILVRTVRNRICLFRISETKLYNTNVAPSLNCFRWRLQRHHGQSVVIKNLGKMHFRWIRRLLQLFGQSVRIQKESWLCSRYILCKMHVDYFVANNSMVNICSLDVTKAFDRVNHYTLFNKLINRNLPVNVLLLLVNWHKHSDAFVIWNGSISIDYLISAGVLSPVLFAVYVDELILSLYKLGFGCHIGIQCMSVLMYADDLVLLSGSLSGLQAMINLCVDKLTEFDLQINVKKSICHRIGKCHNNICSDHSCTVVQQL